jgi:hypothetical protein
VVSAIVRVIIFYGAFHSGKIFSRSRMLRLLVQ